MISFQIEIDRRELENYARGLLLPPFLSHLTLESFRSDRLPGNRDGREPLLLFYSGQGRFEEFPLVAVEHAPAILRRMSLGIDLEKVVFSSAGAIWNWGSAPNFGAGSEKEEWVSDASSSETASDSFSPPFHDDLFPPEKNSANGTILRVFFSAKSSRLRRVSQNNYPGEAAYVSVSRREIFLAHDVLGDYLIDRCREILRPDSPARTEELSPAVDVENFAGTILFRFGPLGGSLVPDDPEIFDDLILYSGLERPLAHVADFVTANPKTGRVILDAAGLRLRLEEKRPL